jgi:hypothetical protein
MYALRCYRIQGIPNVKLAKRGRDWRLGPHLSYGPLD